MGGGMFRCNKVYCLKHDICRRARKMDRKLTEFGSEVEKDVEM